MKKSTGSFGSVVLLSLFAFSMASRAEDPSCVKLFAGPATLPPEMPVQLSRFSAETPLEEIARTGTRQEVWEAFWTRLVAQEARPVIRLPGTARTGSVVGMRWAGDFGSPRLFLEAASKAHSLYVGGSHPDTSAELFQLARLMTPEDLHVLRPPGESEDYLPLFMLKVPLLGAEQLMILVSPVVSPDDSLHEALDRLVIREASGLVYRSAGFRAVVPMLQPRENWGAGLAHASSGWIDPRLPEIRQNAEFDGSFPLYQMHAFPVSDFPSTPSNPIPRVFTPLELNPLFALMVASQIELDQIRGWSWSGRIRDVETSATSGAPLAQGFCRLRRSSHSRADVEMILDYQCSGPWRSRFDPDTQLVIAEPHENLVVQHLRYSGPRFLGRSRVESVRSSNLADEHRRVYGQGANTFAETIQNPDGRALHRQFPYAFRNTPHLQPTGTDTDSAIRNLWERVVRTQVLGGPEPGREIFLLASPDESGTMQWYHFTPRLGGQWEHISRFNEINPLPAAGLLLEVTSPLYPELRGLTLVRSSISGDVWFTYLYR